MMSSNISREVENHNDNEEVNELEEAEEERVSLLSTASELQKLQKKVLEMETQMKQWDQRTKSRRNLRALSRHNMENRISALATNSIIMMAVDEEEESEIYQSVDLDEIRTFPNNTFSFFLVAKYPFIESDRTDNERNGEANNQNRETSTGFSQSKYTQNYLYLPFWLALAILVLQNLIYVLALQNATDFGDPKNPFAFPINVDFNTRTVELIAVIITVYTQNNIFHGVDLFVQSFEHIGKTPGVTIWKYYMAATLQILVGMFGIFVTFIILMQAENVVDLLLDFTAMEFVASLDSAAFILSLRGFLGRPMRLTANLVRDVRYLPKD